jgi:CO/xanthine dehydrogenase FAD-binding subunit
MIPGKFDYFAPQTLDAAPAVLIDINRIPNLDYIQEADGSLRIGALVREADLEKSDVIKMKFPIRLRIIKSLAQMLFRFADFFGAKAFQLD